MKTFLHYFRHYKVATSLNLLGIAITLAGLYVLCCYIDFSSSYNKCFPEYETLYRLDMNSGEDWGTNFPRPLVPHLQKCPQIEDVTIHALHASFNVDKDGTPMSVDAVRELGNALSLFGAKCVDGVLDTKPGEGGVVIPASLAVKLFGDKYVAGKDLKWAGGGKVVITGVYEDFPDNCIMPNDIYYNLDDENLDNYSNWNYQLYFRSKESVDNLQEVLTDLFQQYMADWNGGWDNLTDRDREILKTYKAVPMPVSEMYFSEHGGSTVNGNRNALYMQEFAAILLLIICVINFTNFSMGQAPMRIRSVLTRRVLGESLLRLRISLFGEAAFVGILAYVIAMAIVWAAGNSSWATELFTVNIDLAGHPVLLLLLLGTGICIGLLSAAYSTHYITSFPPVCVMKGNVGLSPQGSKVRTWLVGLQICISLLMTVFIGTTYSQSRFIYTSEYGYAKDSILTEDIWKGQEYSCSKETMRTELEKLPCVQSVSFSQFHLGTADQFMGWGRGNRERNYNFGALPVDWKYLRTYGIDIVEGRDFKEQDADVYIINEAMKRKYPEIEVGKPLYDGDLTVVGVCRDVRAFTTRVDNSQTPIAFIIFGEQYKNWGDPCHFLNVRLAPGVNIMESRRKIAETLDQYAEGAKSDLVFLDSLMEETYRKEFAFVNLMKICSLLTVIITLIGVFCLTMFETEYRRKEIAIRKVMGSSVGQILSLFTGRYAIPLLVSFIVAAPMGYYLSSRWLQNFAEHTPIHWWLFPLSLLIVGAIVLLTVIVQSWHVATMNPFKSIKTE